LTRLTGGLWGVAIGFALAAAVMLIIR